MVAASMDNAVMGHCRTHAESLAPQLAIYLAAPRVRPPPDRRRDGHQAQLRDGAWVWFSLSVEEVSSPMVVARGQLLTSTDASIAASALDIELGSDAFVTTR